MTPDRSRITPEHIRTLRALHAAAKAECCPCGVRRGVCGEHGETETDQTEAEEQR